MNWYKKAQLIKISQEIYRGDTTPISIADLNPEYGTKVLGKELGASASEGPGIYFTTSEKDARMYGQNITKANVHNANIISPSHSPLNRNAVNKILDDVNPDKIEIATSNWNENPIIGREMILDSIMSEENPVDQLMSIWAEVFYHQNPSDFMNLMTKNGIDGIIIPKKNLAHYVIYNIQALEF
jgi:hypothetical protein